MLVRFVPSQTATPDTRITSAALLFVNRRLFARFSAIVWQLLHVFANHHSQPFTQIQRCSSHARPLVGTVVRFLRRHGAFAETRCFENSLLWNLSQKGSGVKKHHPRKLKCERRFICHLQKPLHSSYWEGWVRFPRRTPQ